ncbi:type IV pilus biogenesis protein MshQ, putative [Syntrophotalea carbinolica DSM 2380]|uniref:Type IV pilus biogenesis protein MshQ, putative n=1 Tax=Syntrophotalea carbinolica (strain DSM 2380 / NBRC 103641 / GraBd1) TaxID=338963 RepID=Q3A7I8_SYNC1|nr:LamG domain-containing protein [Syntrophotalea carbinolica]ABA87656.1 type IV pilus biogenesis protein MshQ, putative [Syntrophotalea carbinolica DSM 2380]
MICRTGAFGNRLPGFPAAFLVLLLMVVGMAWPRYAYADCSPYVGAMVINEVYELGGEAWVEVRLLDDSVPASEYQQWSIQVCAKGGGGGHCGTYDIADGEVLYPDTYPYWIRLNVSDKDVNLQRNGGMDVVLEDENGKAIDYLSVNNYDDHAPYDHWPYCNSFLYPTTTGALDSDLKGVYRDPDGTGPWLQLGESGANGEPSEGYDNNTMEGLVAHYALEENANDSSINGHDGSSQGTVSYERAVICDGVVLDGSGYLMVPDNDAFDLRKSLTVSAWIRADSLSVSGHDNLYTILSKDTNYEFHVRGDGSLYWWWSGGSFATGAGLVEPGEWYHFAAVYSWSDKIMYIYLNGQQVASYVYSSQFTANTDPLYIGTDKGNSTGDWPERRFYGAIDEVHIYNNALSQASIAELMNQTNPCGLPVPLAEWRFDECSYDGSAALAEDAQGSYDATVQGTVTSEAEAVVGRSATLDEYTDAFTLNTDVPMPDDWTVSVWFKMPFVNDNGAQYHVLGAMAGGGNDLLWVDDTSNYRWGCWAGYDYDYGLFSFASLADGWHHLVAVGSYGKTRLYIDGSYRDTIALQGNGNLHYLGTSYEKVNGREEGFRAPLDEFLVFDGVLTLPQIQTLYQLQAEGRNLDGTLRSDIICGPAIDHFEIVHDGSALTCAPETVTVRACADDADPCTPYTDDVEITLSPSGWIDGDTQTLSAGSGTFRLRHTTAETVTLSVTGNPAADQSVQCVDAGGGDSCSMVFHESGFLFDVSDMQACTDEEGITFSAVRADATAEHCIGDDSFAGTTRDVAFWSTYQEPGTGTLALVVNDTTVAGADPGTGVSLTFDSEANSTLKVRYSDAGRLLLSARFTGSGEESGLVMEGSDSFVVTPDHLRVRASTDGTTLLDNTTSTGDPLWPAGEDFEVEVAGVCADGTVTPNFAAATTLAATAGNPAAGTFTGGPFAAVDYIDGVVSDSASYSEVGTVTLQAQAANYLGSGIAVTGSATIGRFTPHHFTASVNSPSFATGCSSGGFTYVGQAFAYADAPVITVTAKNKQGDTTANYTGEWWKIAGTTLSGKTYSAADGSLDVSGIPAADPVVSDIGGGMGLLSFDAGSGLSFVRSDPVAPFDADISLAINVFDADGIAADANPVSFGEATAGNGIAFDAGKDMRWGRLAMKNAYGSELVALSMPMRSEYFTGDAFVQNLEDGCTALALSQLTLNNGTTSVSGDQAIAVGSGSSSAALLSPLLAGDAGLTFSAPGSPGYIDVKADLSLLPWLRYDWDGDGSHDDDPTARASFGIYRGRPGMIYIRESFRQAGP